MVNRLYPRAMKRIAIGGLLCLAVMLLTGPPAHAQSGLPEIGFGGAGMSSAEFRVGSIPEAYVRFVRRGPDDSVLFAGYAFDGDAPGRAFVARAGADGALDPAFGDDGIVFLPYATASVDSIVSAFDVAPNGDALVMSDVRNLRATSGRSPSRDWTPPALLSPDGERTDRRLRRSRLTISRFETSPCCLTVGWRWSAPTTVRRRHRETARASSCGWTPRGSRMRCSAMTESRV